jgi:hypothetical protein
MNDHSDIIHWRILKESAIGEPKSIDSFAERKMFIEMWILRGNNLSVMFYVYFSIVIFKYSITFFHHSIQQTKNAFCVNCISRGNLEPVKTRQICEIRLHAILRC